jgi:hypothetical protein
MNNTFLAIYLFLTLLIVVFLTIMIEFKAIAHKNIELLCPDTSFGHTHVVTHDIFTHDKKTYEKILQ